MINLKKYSPNLKNGIPILVLFLLVISSSLKAENLEQLINLEGTWKFTIGDNPEWAAVDYNDRSWDYVYVPRSWENNGFIDYNGYGWYRKEFQVTSSLNEETLLLMLGYIDDVDEVYLNGHLIGTTGVFPPLVKTAYSVLRKYPVPVELLNKGGKNVIAVRVFDDYLDGGIYNGPIGLYRDQDNDLLSLNLAGYWDFETVSKVNNRADEIYNQSDGKIYVPGFWESLGYSEYDGTAVYSTQIRLPDRFNQENIMIVIGYVDDVDKVYINDVKVGTVSNLQTGKNKDRPNHSILRGYKVPQGVLRAGDLNNIQVKVYDTQMLGGIYEGPVGLITEENFELLKEKQVEKPYNMWDSFFKSIFE